MLEISHATAVRFDSIPQNKQALRVLNEISYDFKVVLDSGRSAVIVLPPDVDSVRSRLELAGFRVAATEDVRLTTEEAWFLSDEDEFDEDYLSQDDDDDFGFADDRMSAPGY